MDNLTKFEATADTAEAEREKDENKAAAGLGKFKDVQALLDAYSNLEAEFTRRSQKLRELEKASNARSAPLEEANAETPSPERDIYSGTNFVEAAKNSAEVREAVIGDYLKSVSGNKGVAFLSGGAGVSAARNAPRSIKEAGALAKTFLNKGV